MGTRLAIRDLEAAGVVERRLTEDGGAFTYALTPWGAELREPIEGLVALPGLLGGRAPDRSPTVGIAVDGGLVQVRVVLSVICDVTHRWMLASVGLGRCSYRRILTS
ncbi:hypothetical protein AB4305_31740 [Nocardia sp. 2YAB30]|uniref:hypothetical protein n=1 Tax=Nocardia sp. 2YAB30 TaxID=3233022 RepID=UPI003F9D6B08